MFAIVVAGGRQEKVTPGGVLLVDRLEVEDGAEYVFDQVLLVGTEDGKFLSGAPFVKGATVTAVVDKQVKAKKIRIFKTKRRKQYRRSKGHRTQQTRVVVKSINV
jgi:large subunit ribosomal protein L21